MVLAYKVGKTRSLAVLPLMGAVGLLGQVLLFVGMAIALGFGGDDDALLGFGILGLLLGGGMALSYYVYVRVWIRMAHHEVHKQFELRAQGMSPGITVYVLSFFVPVFLYIYEAIFASQVDSIRRRMRLPRGISPTTFVVLTVVGGVPVLFLAILLRIAAESFTDAQLVWLLAAYGGLLLVDGVLSVVAYTWMQATLNQVWSAFDARMAQLNQARMQGPATPRAPTGGGPPGAPWHGGPAPQPPR